MPLAIWDLFMDFSLLQTESRHIGLRDILALKRRWPYYSIMVVDPIIRFAWIFYAIFTHDRQHSTLVSFLVAFIEVIRRGLWAIFRVENEHCANVSQYKASRDVPLPYRIEPLMDRASSDISPSVRTQEPPTQEQEQAPTTPAAQESPQEQRRRRQEEGDLTASSTAVASTLGSGPLRRRTGGFSTWSLSKALAEAHIQDFVKKRKPQDQLAQEEGQELMDDYDDDDDDDDDEEDEETTAEAQALRRRRGNRGGDGLV